MGRASFKAGGVFAQNLQAGSISLSPDSNGDATTTVTFEKAMKSAPTVILTSAQQLTTGVLSHASKTGTGFQARVDASDITGALIVDYIAYDDSYI